MLPTRSTWAHFWMLISVLLVDFSQSFWVLGVLGPFLVLVVVFLVMSWLFLIIFWSVGFLGLFLVFGCCCLCFLYWGIIVFGAFLRAPDLSEVGYWCLICWFWEGFWRLNCVFLHQKLNCCLAWRFCVTLAQCLRVNEGLVSLRFLVFASLITLSVFWATMYSKSIWVLCDTF